MKRSEMVKVLQDSFLYHMNNSPPDEMFDTDEKMYDRILLDLEVKGMKPPSTNVYLPEVGTEVLMNKWDKESE